MDKIIFFQSSMPRAGSTLLQNIIGQNPNFHVTPTSGISSLIEGAKHSFSNTIEFKKEKDYNLCKTSFYNFCKEGIKGYYSNIDKPFILDKNREWIQHVDILKQMYSSPKIICLVRDIRSIFSSYEKQYLNNFNYPYELSNSHTFPSNPTISERIELYKNTGPLLTFIKSLFNHLQFKNRDNIKMIRFEDLCSNPQKTLNDIYNYLEVPYFSHNFSSIDQITYENDNFHMFGEHKIKHSLSLPSPDWEEYLTLEESNKIYEDYLWFFEYFNYTK